MSTIAASIAPRLLELETSNLVRGFVWECRAGAQIIFPESGRSLASRSVQWGTWRLANVFVGCTGADRRNLGDEWRLTGAIVCVITKSAILISAQFTISSPLFVHGPKSNHRVAMSYHCYVTAGFCILGSLLWGSTVGCPSDSLPSCLEFKKHRTSPQTSPCVAMFWPGWTSADRPSRMSFVTGWRVVQLRVETISITWRHAVGYHDVMSTLFSIQAVVGR